MALRAFVFDAYGTLFDVNAAVRRFDADVGPRAADLAAIWRQRQLEYSWVLTLAGHYRPFWQLTEESLDFALAATGVDAALKPMLLDAYRTLDAYPDAPGALAGLRAAGHATAILSNGSPDMLRAAVEGAALEPLLDHVLSVDTVKLYKPRPEVYTLALQTLGCAPSDITFVSSNRWDIAGAAAFGFRPAWIDRAGVPAEYAGLDPVVVLRSLDELAGLAP